MVRRFKKLNKWDGERRRTTSTWGDPKTWNRKAIRDGQRETVFCASWADVFDNQVDPAWRVELWALIRETPALDWQLLTKRPQNIRKMLPADWRDGYGNVWLGTTTEDQKTFDRRWPLRARIPAVVRFISYEPAIGPVRLPFDGLVPDWVIIGGESGPLKIQPGAPPDRPHVGQRHDRRLQGARCAAVLQTMGAIRVQPARRQGGTARPGEDQRPWRRADRWPVRAGVPGAADATEDGGMTRRRRAMAAAIPTGSVRALFIRWFSLDWPRVAPTRRTRAIHKGHTPNEPLPAVSATRDALRSPSPCGFFP